jgi:hypothetical protein
VARTAAAASSWSVMHLNIGARHVGALTCSHPAPELRFHGEIPIE